MSLPTATIEFAHRMFDAARSGDTDILVHAVKSGLPINMTNAQGNTLLMLAAYAGHTSLAQELISLGADVNRLNDRGQSIIAGAVFKDYGELVALLMNAGADPRSGRPNAVETAVMFGRNDIIKVLGAN